MSDYTQTPNYALYKPTPNMDFDIWGDHLNANADTLDGLIKKLDTRGSGGGVLLVTDYLPAGQPDGITDNTPYLQDALDAAAGVTDTGHRELAPGAFTLVVPAATASYVVGSGVGLQIPSNTHLIIEAGATLLIAPGSNCNCLGIVPGASNILIELYGTLNGNYSGGNTAGGGIVSLANGACSNVYVRGNRQGRIICFALWPVNISSCTSGKVSGITMMDCGNTAEFCGVSTRIPVSGATYNNSTGAASLTTATAHGIAVGGIFTFVDAVGAGAYFALQGEFTALAGTTGTTVVYNAGAGNDPGGTLTITGGTVGTCVKSYNVGFEDCIIDGIRDIGICLYGGCVGGYIRGCEVRFCSGPLIFCDHNQPGANIDCEISGCYSHHNFAGGPGVVSNVLNLKNVNARVFNNLSCFNMRGGIGVGSVTGADIYGNLIHDNWPAFTQPYGPSAQLTLGIAASFVNVHANTLRNPRQASIAQTPYSLATGSTYSPSTGAVSLTTTAPHGIVPGGSFMLGALAGTGQFAALFGWHTATAGTGGSTVNFTAPTGLTMTISAGSLVAVTFAAAITISSGTYNSVSGAVTLTTATAHGLANTAPFVISGITGTGAVANLNGYQTATTGSSGTTLNFTDSTNMALTITGGTILPAAFGISIILPNDSQIEDNSIADYQSTPLMTACIGGTWGNRGLSKGNHYGPMLATGPVFPADATSYINASIRGVSYDIEITQASGLGVVRSYPLAEAGTVNILSETTLAVVANGSSLAAGTIVLPVPSIPYYSASTACLEITFSNRIGTLTLQASGTLTVVNPPTTVAAAGTSFNFVQSGTTWLRRIMA